MLHPIVRPGAISSHTLRRVGMLVGIGGFSRVPVFLPDGSQRVFVPIHGSQREEDPHALREFTVFLANGVP
jgi:hypothetical protein